MTKNQFGSSGQTSRLITRLDEFSSMLYVEEPFRAIDLDMDKDKASQLIPLLHQEGAIKPVDSEINNGSKRHYWKWKPNAKQRLRNVHSKRNELPCGHRAHIFNRSDIPEDKYSCKWCNKEGNVPEYSAETVKECL